jgi:hypothetical protein
MSLKPSALAVAVAAAAFGPQHAQAQESPWYLGIGQAFSRESNLFRAPSGAPETSDSFATTSLLGGLNLPLGRQRVFADAAVRFNKYQDNEQLDNTAHNLSTGLDWEALDKWSGRLAYVSNRTLNRFGSEEGPALTTKNLEHGEQASLTAQYGRAGLLAIEGGYTHRRLDYSAPEYAFLEFQQDTVHVGLLYRPSGLLTLGVAYRNTDGRYPFAIQPVTGVFLPDDFTRNDVDFTAAWVATGQSTVRARISYTKEEHDAIVSRDVSGATGAISWDYKPTGKLGFLTELIRDTGAQSSFNRLALEGTSSVGNNSQKSTTLLGQMTYAATEKIGFELGGRYVQRDLVNTAGLTTGAASTEAGSDKFTRARLAVNYEALRSLTFGCAYEYEKRSSSTTLTYSYDANVVSCFGQLRTQ